MLSLRHYLILTLFGINSYCYSQYNTDLGLIFGGSGYLGDIGGKNMESKNFIGDLLLMKIEDPTPLQQHQNIQSQVVF